MPLPDSLAKGQSVPPVQYERQPNSNSRQHFVRSVGGSEDSFICIRLLANLVASVRPERETANQIFVKMSQARVGQSCYQKFRFRYGIFPFSRIFSKLFPERTIACSDEFVLCLQLWRIGGSGKNGKIFEETPTLDLTSLRLTDYRSFQTLAERHSAPPN
jgi:hypothetical protein